MTTVLIFPVNPVGRDFITNAMQHNRYRTMFNPRIDRMGKQFLDLQGLGRGRNIIIFRDSSKNRITNTAAYSICFVAGFRNRFYDLFYIFG